MLDKRSRKERAGKELTRQLKKIVRIEDNLANAIGFFVLGGILLAAGAVTGAAFLGLIGGGCIILGLERLVRRSAAKNGDVVSDLRADEDRNREKNGK